MQSTSIGAVWTFYARYTGMTEVTSWSGSGPMSCRSHLGVGWRPRRPTAPFAAKGHPERALHDRSVLAS